jgi:quercetin dioxygenase-like cupin family protein
MDRFTVRCLLALASALCVPALAHEPLAIKPLAERKLDVLPAGPLFWRLENFASLAEAQAAAGATSLAVQAGGKAWLFTLGAAGGSTPGGSAVTEVGPLPTVVAKRYLLRINEAIGVPGSITKPHTHPGSEAFYVLAGETSSRSPAGVFRVKAGEKATGNGPDVPMQVSSSGTSDLHSLVMFVVDADRPFSSPATLP